MTMEESSSLFKTVSSETVALACAVAALQNVSSAISDTKSARSPPPVSILPSPERKEQCDEDDTAESTEESNSEIEASDRLAKNRERNREHARKTRLRKKQQLQVLQTKIRTLEAERQSLKQSLRDCSIASILLGLSGAEDIEVGSTTNELDESEVDATSKRVQMLTCGKRKRFSADEVGKDCHETSCADLAITISGKKMVIGSKSQINWKSGVYTDNEGLPHQLSPAELESLRRERNRRHAKMTRDRKKNFCHLMQQTVDDLEAENARMRELIAQRVTPVNSPQLISQPSPEEELSPIRTRAASFSLGS